MSHDPTDWKHCTGCGSCKAIRKEGWVPQEVYVTTVSGGANDTPEYRFHKDFDKGMYAYEDARKEGLSPYSTTLAGVERAQKEVKSHTAALRDSKKVGIEFGPGVKVAPGVDKEKYIK
jgi:hypothetical protein